MVKALLKNMISFWVPHLLEALPADPSAWVALQFGENRAGEICKVGQKKMGFWSYLALSIVTAQALFIAF